MRTVPRFRRRFKVTLGATPSFTRDVSKGGFCTEAMRVLPSGTQVSGTINANGREISFAGRIAWSRPGNAQMNIRGQMGVSFAKVPSEFVEMLETNTKRP